MDDVLDVYDGINDPAHAQVCVDDKSVEFIAVIREPLPATPGQPERFDYEYQRKGTANLFLFFQPLAGWRKVRITDRRTKIDFAECMRYLVDELFPEAESTVLILVNPNTHTPASPYEAFQTTEATRILIAPEWPQTTFVDQDEATVYLQSTLWAVWATRGQTPVARVPLGREEVNLHGALNVRTAWEIAMQASGANSDTTAQYPRQVEEVRARSLVGSWEL